MNWKDARTRLKHSHVVEAAEWIDSHCSPTDFSNLYQKTSCHPPRHRHLSFDNKAYPAKAFGYLTLLMAGWDQNEDYRPTVNEVVSPIRKFGVIDK